MPRPLPPWAREMIEVFKGGAVSQFILHGNIADLVPFERPGGRVEYASLETFLHDALFAQYDVVLNYDRSGGLQPVRGRERFLRGRVGGERGDCRPALGGPARERHDRAATCLEEVAHGLAHQAHRFEEVDAQRLVPVLVPELVAAVERRLAQDRGICDDDVDPPLPAHSLGEERACRTRHAEVRLDEKAPLLGDGCQGDLGPLAVAAVVRDHRGTACAELGGRDRADPSGRPGDEDDPAVEAAGAHAAASLRRA
jgi:hypothetical protein